MPPVRDRPIVHFTHVSNLPGITTAGCVKSDSPMRRGGADFRECGNREIKSNRRTTSIPVEPFGVVADYVPFYFAPRSPMLYTISRGGVPTYTEGQEPLVYLWSRLSVVSALGIRWVGSDGNCASSISVQTNDWAQLEESVDWSVMELEYWHNTLDDGDRMRRRMAEFLVHQTFPIHGIRGLVAKTAVIAEQAERHLDGRLPVHVKPGWYYGT